MKLSKIHAKSLSSILIALSTVAGYTGCDNNKSADKPIANVRQTVFDFTNGTIPPGLFYCYSIHNTTFDTLSAGKGCVTNATFDAERDPSAFIGLQTEQLFQKGCTITIECDFEGLGAPLIPICDKFFDFNGHRTYDRRFEAVAYKDGVNIWDVRIPDMTKPEIDPIRMSYCQFPVADNERVILTVTTSDYGLEVSMNGHHFGVSCPDLPDRFSAGIMACEGICHLYKLTITEPL